MNREQKQCLTCHNLKFAEDYYRKRDKSCKTCTLIKRKQHYLQNRDKIIQRVARYTVKNNSTLIEKLFSCLKLGFDKAKELAICFRKQGIIDLNLNGAGYTERHGK